MSKKSLAAARGSRGKSRQAAPVVAECHCQAIHRAVIETARQKIADNAALRRAAELFTALDDPTRLKIINALLIAEMCVCDLAALLALTSPAISYHLKTLRQAQLVKYRRDGKIVYYSLADDHVAALFAQAIEHVSEN